MELPTDPELRRRFLEVITGPMRMRELGLELAKAASDDFDEILRAIRHLGPSWADWEQFVQVLKTRVIDALEQGAEYEYIARTREQALKLMEQNEHGSLTADEAIACVESSMLDATLAASDHH